MLRVNTNNINEKEILNRLCDIETIDQERI